MKRWIFISLALLLASAPAHAVMMSSKCGKAGGTFTAVNGLAFGITFMAPFNDPASPVAMSGTGSFTVTRAHDATHTATFLHPTTGFVTVGASNVLRIESAGALVEGTGTNIVLQSETLATTWAPTTCTVASNQIAAPDGNVTAESLTATAGNATLLQSITGTAVPYTFTIYIKRKTGSGNVDVSADATTWTTCSINAVTWTRCTDTRTLTVAAYTPGIRIVTNTDAVYAWGGQMEIGSVATSYVGPTVAVAQIRNPDVVTFPTASNVVGTVGTARASYKTYLNNGSTNQYILDLDTARPALFINGADEKVSINDGLTTVSFGTADTTGTAYGAASRWNVSGTAMRVVRSGGAVVTGSFDGDMNLAANATVGDTGATGSQLWGNVRNLLIWNRALTDDELKAVSP